METIIAAVIAGAVALIGAYYMYLGKINKINDKLSDLSAAMPKQADGRNELSKEHGGLSKEHTMIQSTVNRIESVSEKTEKAVSDIGYGIREEKTVMKMRYEAMTSDQRKMDDAIAKGVESITALKEGFAAATLENQDLRARLAAKDAKIEKLTSQVDKLYSDNVILAKECQRQTPKSNSHDDS